MEKELKKEEIKNRVIAIYDNLKDKYDKEGSKNKINRVIYYDTLPITSPAGGLELYGAYVVRIVNDKEKVLYEIYDNNALVATVNQDGIFLFEEKYKQDLIDRKEFLWANQVSQMEIYGAKVQEPEELKENDKEFVEQDIIEEKNKKEEEKESKNDEKELTEDEQEEAIAKEMGLSKEELVCKAKIDPKQILEEGEVDQKSFEDIAGVKGKYKTIYVVNANKQTEGNNKRFAFVGITKEGKVEHINLPTKGTPIPQRKIYAMNRDGSEVKEKQVTEMFMANGDIEKGFSVTVGQYGKLEIDYLRRSPGENTFLGSPVETEKQRFTKKPVREEMSTYTSKYGLNDVVGDTKEQIGELESKTTNLENIDDKPNNDKALDPNEKITMHDGSTTTLADEAEKLGMNLGEYNNCFEKAEGDCPADKIKNVREEIRKQKESKEPMGREDIGGRLTPEEEAWLRMQNNNK